MRVNLKKEMFSDREFVLSEYGNMKATAFRYSTGVEAMRLENNLGYFIILPYQGQQIWRLHFADRDLNMKTTVKEPISGVKYLETYGGFLYHCGISSVGAADAEHLQHGEIPNREYSSAYLKCGKDEKGRYMAVGGVLDLDIAFTRKYQFRPECRMYENEAVLEIYIELENMRSEPMEYAYLCHINYAPIDGARLVCNAKTVKIHRNIPDNLSKQHKIDLIKFMDKLEADPSVGDIVGASEQVYTPEICSTMMYEGERGYTMQVVNDEGACYVSHPTKELPYAIRWISRTASEDAMGMVLPATCEHLGYQYAKENAQMKYLAPRETVSFTIEVGWLETDKVKDVIRKINM